LSYCGLAVSCLELLGVSAHLFVKQQFCQQLVSICFSTCALCQNGSTKQRLLSVSLAVIPASDVKISCCNNQLYILVSFFSALALLLAPCGPGATPPFRSLPHLLIYILVSFTFPLSLSYLLRLFSCFSIQSTLTSPGSLTPSFLTSKLTRG